MKFFSFLKDWSLPIAMLGGVAAYFIYVNIPFLDDTHAAANEIISYIQPGLIFAMLFVTFCKISFSDLRLERWHFILLAFQLVSFILFSLVAAFVPMNDSLRVLVESFMLCLICPTATAAAVITARLGGSAASLLTYTITMNFAVALVAPLFLTLAHPVEGVDFLASFLLILGKVFPLLLCPLVAASLVRRLLPSVQQFIVKKCRNLPFYLWLVALSLAIALTTKSIVHTTLSIFVQMGIAAVSLICCVVQFAFGRYIGRRYGDAIAGGQSLGQKNTVFAIWLAYTFLTPVTSIAGGFYSLWHNSVNTWQLYRKNHPKK
ncbi:MAG: transporter [Bacteroidales bacterium]|nr:transporter [Bacteroidales bacterium]